MQQQTLEQVQYITESLDAQVFVSYLERLAELHRNKRSIMSLEARREPRNQERYNAAIEALDEVDNEIDAALCSKAGFDTERVVDFLTAIDAVYGVERALHIANKGVMVELVSPVKPEPEPTPEWKPGISHESEYYMALANGR